MPFALRLNHESNNHYQTIDKNLKATESKLVNMLNNINKQLDEFSRSVSSTVDGLKESHSISIGDNEAASVNVPVTHLASSIVSEQKEKEQRQLNIILHNLILNPLRKIRIIGRLMI